MEHHGGSQPVALALRQGQQPLLRTLLETFLKPYLLFQNQILK